MPTNYQITGQKGETFVIKNCTCPKCKKKEKTLRKLPPNFKCADLICDFCGYLAQVKTMNVKDVEIKPDRILGSASKPQEERMDAGIFFPLFIVLMHTNKKAVYYLPADLQVKEMFEKRKPLSQDAKRPGWQGFNYKIKDYKERMIRLI